MASFGNRHQAWIIWERFKWKCNQREREKIIRSGEKKEREDLALDLNRTSVVLDLAVVGGRIPFHRLCSCVEMRKERKSRRGQERKTMKKKKKKKRVTHEVLGRVAAVHVESVLVLREPRELGNADCPFPSNE